MNFVYIIFILAFCILSVTSQDCSTVSIERFLRSTSLKLLDDVEASAGPVFPGYDASCFDMFIVESSIWHDGGATSCKLPKTCTTLHQRAFARPFVGVSLDVCYGLPFRRRCTRRCTQSTGDQLVCFVCDDRLFHFKFYQVSVPPKFNSAFYLQDVLYILQAVGFHTDVSHTMLLSRDCIDLNFGFGNNKTRTTLPVFSLYQSTGCITYDPDIQRTCTALRLPTVDIIRLIAGLASSLCSARRSSVGDPRASGCVQHLGYGGNFRDYNHQVCITSTQLGTPGSPLVVGVDYFPFTNVTHCSKVDSRPSESWLEYILYGVLDWIVSEFLYVVETLLDLLIPFVEGRLLAFIDFLILLVMTNPMLGLVLAFYVYFVYKGYDMNTSFSLSGLAVVSVYIMQHGSVPTFAN